MSPQTPLDLPKVIPESTIGVMMAYVEAKDKATNDRIDRHEKRHSDELEKVRLDHESRIRPLEEFRARMLGALLFAGALGGFLGALASRFVK